MSGLLVIIATAAAGYSIGCIQGYRIWGHRFNREVAKLLNLII